MKQISTVIISAGCVVGFFLATWGCDDPSKCEYGTDGCKCAEGDKCESGLKCVDGECISTGDNDAGAGNGGKGGSSGSESGAGGSNCEDREVCDGEDNDCDGDIDEDSLDEGGECVSHEPGACARGVERCRDGSLVCVPEVEPTDEVCDGEDNDCDGDIDEDSLDEGGDCNIDKPGLCGQGVERCQDGSLVCVQEVEPTDEVCDGEDNDCDGDTDEDDPDEGDDCDTGEDGPCGPGTRKCRDGSLVCVSNVEAEDEICDGEDNDCDGQTDETCCDPRDPGDVCDADEHCVPRDDDAVPDCVGQAGIKEQNQYCEDIDDCVATADCQVYRADKSTSKICVEQCRIGEDDCDDPDETCEEFDPPRVIGEQEWGVCKSIAPDPPSDWTCDSEFYGFDNGCDCGCGVFDPDCDNATPAVCDAWCSPGACHYDFCGPPAENTFYPNDNAICEPQPEGWTCQPLTYGDGEVCDCGCGVQDPDCDSPDPDDCDYCPVGSCAVSCVPEDFVDGDNSICPPTGWICPLGYLNNAICDCGCGFVDPDCAARCEPGDLDCTGLTSDFCQYCGPISCSPDDPETTEVDEMCTLIDAEHNAVCDGATVPEDWDCIVEQEGDEAWYLDDDCDCGCNVIDPDCIGNTADVCEYDWCEMYEMVPDPSDNSQCI